MWFQLMIRMIGDIHRGKAITTEKEFGEEVVSLDI